MSDPFALLLMMAGISMMGISVAEKAMVTSRRKTIYAWRPVFW